MEARDTALTGTAMTGHSVAGEASFYLKIMKT